jgi:hypothetical protein
MSVDSICSTRGRIPTAGDAVKGRVYAAGVKPAELAAAIGYSRAAVSLAMSGRLRTPTLQYDIYCAFCRLTGTDYGALPIQEFWGTLYRRRTL